MPSSGPLSIAQPNGALHKGHQGLHARTMQVQAEGGMALRAVDLVADDVVVEMSMSTLLAVGSSSLWSRLYAPRLFDETTWLMLIAMASLLPGDSRPEFS
ncbi:hypothetical protein PF005_g4902 [Phytophthora fragariae]|uniref:Uncharacterized protein n=1 Tax=Phytophthora fragariae TaxID=53985 RepID=A0A6A3UIE1_9STRA|nr:hypothetical protein PF003_g18684 [Phytophthora fragariae]KAE8944935.1 hypothetical protein PF009_g5408 [Phytophthora fragariae]KAE9022295.1 hypothetical protein PF011_g4544 [Phytophthora fragariae]KAE9129097.1 hypothetical protein PF010_g4269 [Phytophthora fragariae]KAE9129337.1 hypothetical protein PF007_g4923 [Phytophthora fragariae]